MIRFNSIKGIRWGILYWLAINLAYFWALQVHWAEDFPATFDILRFFAATAGILLLLILLPKENEITILYLYIILFLVIIPLTVTYVGGQSSGFYVFSVIGVYAGAEIIACHVKLKEVQIDNGRGKGLSYLLVAGAIIYVAVTVVLLFMKLGVPKTTALNLTKIYEIRETLPVSARLYNMFQMTAKAILPFLLAIALFKKNRREVILLLGVQFLLFLWLANKTTLVSLGVFLFGYYFSKKENTTALFCKAMTIGVLALTILEGLNTGEQTGLAKTIASVFSIFIRRTVFVPAVLKGHFFEFFVSMNNELVGLFGTMVAPLLTRMGVYEPYADLTYTKVIGNLYAGGANANTGMFGKELAHFGYLGILVAGVCLILFLLAVKVCESRNGKQFACGISIYIIVSLQDAGSMEIITFSPMLMVFIMLLIFNMKDYMEKRTREEPKSEIRVDRLRPDQSQPY